MGNKEISDEIMIRIAADNRYCYGLECIIKPKVVSTILQTKTYKSNINTSCTVWIWNMVNNLMGYIFVK
jgi:hypothetical protein